MTAKTKLTLPLSPESLEILRAVALDGARKLHNRPEATPGRRILKGLEELGLGEWALKFKAGEGHERAIGGAK